jgi:helix-turn-helix protein
VFEIGNSLREARVRQQLELTEVELATKIRARYLRALEEENFEALPAQTYVKGFLRTYADYLGLDGQLYVDEFNSRYGEGEDYREPLIARRTSAVSREHRRLARRWVLIALAAISALVAFVVAAWKFGGDSGPPIPNLANTTTATTTGSKPTVTRPAAPVHAKARPVRFRIYMRAVHGNCWMDVRNNTSAGQSRYTGTLELGQAKLFSARRLWINFGAPGNLAIVFNRKLVNIPRGGAYRFTAHGFSPAA